jgi:hypothetical protein
MLILQAPLAPASPPQHTHTHADGTQVRGPEPHLQPAAHSPQVGGSAGRGDVQARRQGEDSRPASVAVMRSGESGHNEEPGDGNLCHKVLG